MWIVEWSRSLRNKRNMKFEYITCEWLENRKKSVKKSTYSNYKCMVNRYILSKLGNLKVKKLEKYDFNEFVDELNEQYSTKTVRDIIVILKSILNYAENEYNCKTRTNKIISPKPDSEPIVILSKREINRLEKCCLKENTLKSLGIIICLNTGLRIGEICALKWKNIDLDKREIRVKQTLQRIYDNETDKTDKAEKTDKTKIQLDTPKSKKSVRNIPISNKIYDIWLPLKKKYNDEDFFLTGNLEKIIEPRNYQMTFKELLKKSKIKKSYKFHTLRHTCATNCIEVGMDVKSLSEILGHANVQITLDKYVHSSYKTKKKYLEKL